MPPPQKLVCLEGKFWKIENSNLAIVLFLGDKVLHCPWNHRLVWVGVGGAPGVLLGQVPRAAVVRGIYLFRKPTEEREIGNVIAKIVIGTGFQ